MRAFTLPTFVAMIGAAMLLALPDTARAQRKTLPREFRFAAPDTAPAVLGAPHRKVSMPIPLHDVVPELGTLDVDPTTLPAGPFLAYDRDGKLVSSIYMIPLTDMNGKKSFSDLSVAQERVDHVDIIFNAGHPTVAEPHYHVILWYVSAPSRVAGVFK
jgi:hypothetical protein